MTIARKTEYIVLRLPPKLKAAAEKAAAVEEKSLSEYVRRIVEEEIRKGGKHT